MRDTQEKGALLTVNTLDRLIKSREKAERDAMAATDQNRAMSARLLAECYNREIARLLAELAERLPV
jgi:hypothetical protein